MRYFAISLIFFKNLPNLIIHHLTINSHLVYDIRCAEPGTNRHYVDESTIPASTLRPSRFLPEKSDFTFLHQRIKAVVMPVLAKHLPTLHELADVMETTMKHL